MKISNLSKKSEQKHFKCTEKVILLDYIISASTDIGIKKDTNQDGLLVKSFNTRYGKMVFAVLCDGMGGLAKGEIASSETIRAFDEWFYNSLPGLLSERIEDSLIRQQWSDIVRNQNERIKKYSNSLNLNMGTTVVAGLFTQNRVFIMNVGDSRAYEIMYGVRQITKDHTVVNDEVEKGILTPEQALNDPRRNVLLQCIGASDKVYPGFYFEEVKSDAVYMLCSDGFIHEITENEIFNAMKPANMTDKITMKQNIDLLIETDKQRLEKDNISVIAIKTF